MKKKRLVGSRGLQPRLESFFFLIANLREVEKSSSPTFAQSLLYSHPAHWPIFLSTSSLYLILFLGKRDEIDVDLKLD
jgi:hypothetical protein